MHFLSPHSSPTGETTRKSLQELEANDWGEPPPQQQPSNLVRTVYRLRRVPLQEWTAENIRMMVGQCLSLNHVIPLAIERLQIDPWPPEASFPGDLLRFVLNDPQEHKHRFWKENPELWLQMKAIFEQAIALLPTLDERAISIVTERRRIGPNEEPSLIEQLNNALHSNWGN